MSEEPESAVVDQRITYHYLKSNYFRVIHCDGAHGGITPTGHIQFNLYNERPAIPTKTVHSVTPDGTLGQELRDLRESKDGVVREMEVGVIMTVDAVRALHGWLETKLRDHERLVATLASRSQEKRGASNDSDAS